jgi:hypothetical protein
MGCLKESVCVTKTVTLTKGHSFIYPVQLITVGESVVELESFGESVTGETSLEPPAEKKIKTKKTRLLKKEEREEIKNSIHKEAVVQHVLKKVPNDLMSTLYPERMQLWAAICDSEIIHC